MNTSAVSRLFFVIFLISVGCIVYIMNSFNPSDAPEWISNLLRLAVFTGLVSFIIFPFAWARSLSEPAASSVSVLANWKCTSEEWGRFLKLDEELKNTHDKSIIPVSYDPDVFFLRNPEYAYYAISIGVFMAGLAYIANLPRYASGVIVMIGTFELLLYFIYRIFVLRYRFSNKIIPEIRLYLDNGSYNMSIGEKNYNLTPINGQINSVEVGSTENLSYLEIIYSFRSYKHGRYVDILRIPFSEYYKGEADAVFERLKAQVKA